MLDIPYTIFNIPPQFPLFLNWFNKSRNTRDRGSTRSASARRQEGDRFKSRADTGQY